MDMTFAHRCPHCHEDLHGGVIPQGLIDEGYYPAVCSQCGMANHWGKEIAIYDTSKDRTVEWLCPFCEGRWER